MSKLIITVGLPGSGKTTWAKEQPFFRVNRDDIRAELGVKTYSRHNEDIVRTERDRRISKYLGGNATVICDDTNIIASTRSKLAALAKEHNAEFEVNDSFLQVPIEECFKRDLQRERSVGKDVIERMYYQYWEQQEKPDNEHGPEAIICDLDGTLALEPEGANHYDRDFTKDIINRPVLCAITTLRQGRWNVIFTSGRKESARAQTVEWLANYAIKPEWHFDYQLFMRADDDNRKDTIVKKEIYMNNIAGKYRVLCVFDDRPSVVRMWRAECGLTVFAVAPSIEF